MLNPDLIYLLGVLAVMLAGAKTLALATRAIGWPPLLGEMFAGLLLGRSVFGIVNTDDRGLQAIAEVGLVLFIFHVGLELDYRKFLAASRPAAVVAGAAVLLPFTLGCLACSIIGLDSHVALGAGAAITATSLGLTARVLTDLNRLEERESAIILAAALFSTILGLAVLGIVTGLAAGKDVSLAQVVFRTGVTYAILFSLLFPGAYLIPWLFTQASKVKIPGLLTALASITALGLGWVAVQAGSVSTMGGLLAGILIGRSSQAAKVRENIGQVEGVSASVAFVFLGAGIDLHMFHLTDGYHRQVVLAAVLLTVAAVVGKFLAGYTVIGWKLNRKVIGMGMVPHGEIGLLFANIALASRLFDRPVFSAVAVAVFVTTYVGLVGMQALFPMAARKTESAEPTREVLASPG
jgi:Kef-type K+ transport system membrane component KefB